MLEDAFQDRWESFLKVCTINGTPLGFCGWTIIERTRGRQVEASNGQTATTASTQNKQENHTVNMDGWNTLSRALRMEREQVLKDLDNICRKLIHVEALQPADGF
jgi:hypothetical protein